jgi:hypothetical protein
MKTRKNLTLILFALFAFLQGRSQLDVNGTSISVYAGMINYQGDLNPNSFTFQQSNPVFGLLLRQPITSWLTARAGFFYGNVDAADRNNRDYLKPRNLSFHSSLKELQGGFEINFLNAAGSRIIPYMYAGVALFHFDPWTYDIAGSKTYLQPLSTEGQGLAEFPKQRPYKLTQVCLPFGGGFKFRINDDLQLGVEFSQRKTFTDYLDDVSSFFVDEDILLQAKGPKAVELAYRGDELPGGISYPAHGEQRGTPGEMDWYYLFGMTIEMKLGSILNKFSGMGNKDYSQRCPRNVNY